MSDIAPFETAARSRRLSWSLLILQMFSVAAVLWNRGRLTPQIVPDTATYAGFPWGSLTEALNGIRTPGYPLFLKFASLLGDEFSAVPTLQMLAYFGAAALFFRVLSQTLLTSTLSCAAASSLLYANILHGYVATVATDTLAASIGVVTTALTISAAQQCSMRRLVLLAFAMAAAWLIRPAYLFLIAFVPVLAIIAAPIVTSASAVPPKRLLAGVLCAVCLPLLAYCGLRMATVGRFGIVSFGGYNLVGVTGQSLEASDVSALSPPLRGLADLALQARDLPDRPRSPYANEPRLHYLRMETEYDTTIWHDFAIALDHSSPGIDANSSLKRLGLALLIRHPRDYVVWLLKATRQAAKKLVWDFLDNPVYLLGSALAVGLHILSLVRRSTSATPNPGLRLLTGIALLYAVLSLAVVVPVCPPLGRFTDAAGVFLGAPLLLLIATFGGSIGKTGDKEAKR